MFVYARIIFFKENAPVDQTSTISADDRDRPLTVEGKYGMMCKVENEKKGE